MAKLSLVVIPHPLGGLKAEAVEEKGERLFRRSKSSLRRKWRSSS